MIGRLADEITRRDYSVLLHKVIAVEPGWLERIIQAHRADGLLLIGQSNQHEALNVVAGAYRPMVVWGAQLPGQRYCGVGSDNVEGARLAVRHLTDTGRRRIAFLGAIDATEAILRFEGYRKGLAEAGLAFDPALAVPTPLMMEEAQGAIEAFIASGVTFDAVFAFSDVVALAAERALSGAGLAVPGDVAVVGFDDIVLARYGAPPLTTVRQNLQYGAEAMVDLLFRRMAGEDTASVLTPVELVVRGSSV
jgi:DNA-binding LacI/PurR family transcriptional regulator